MRKSVLAGMAGLALAAGAMLSAAVAAPTIDDVMDMAFAIGMVELSADDVGMLDAAAAEIQVAYIEAISDVMDHPGIAAVLDPENLLEQQSVAIAAAGSVDVLLSGYWLRL